MHVSRLRVLCIEVFKTLKNINPSFMNEIFKIKSSVYSSHSWCKTQIMQVNKTQVKLCGSKLVAMGLRVLGLQPK